MKTGSRCRLLGNPPKHKSGTGTGDKLDGKGIAVSPHTLEYHAPGSLIPKGSKVDGQDWPHGGMFFHVYKRISPRSDAFKYSHSNTVAGDPREDSERADLDYATVSDLINGRRNRGNG